MHSIGFLESFAILGVVGLGLVGAISAAQRAHRRKEMEHAERMKSLEMGLVPLPSGLDWPAASVCIAIGAGVPIGSFLVAWLATMTADVPGEIWLAPVFVSFAAIGSARKLAYRVIDPAKSNSYKNVIKQASMPDGKPAFDPDAYDVVGSRG
jgi:hypothetical protein